MNVKIILKYTNNLCRKQISAFDFCLDKESDLTDFILKLKNELNNELLNEFDNERLYVVFNNQFLKLSKENMLEFLSKENEITILYSDIIAFNDAAHVCECKTKNGSTICFDVFPREQNHRYTPHVNAVHGTETIRITISDNPTILKNNISSGNKKEGYSGNNKKHEKIAIKYVKEHKDFFLQKWNEFVESQFK